MKFIIQKFRNKLREKLPNWINLQNMIFLSVIIAFIIIVIWSDAISDFFAPLEPVDSGITPTATTLFGTPTPLPAEWLTSADQTDGIMVGGIIIIVTILVGTAAIVLRDRN
jgi:hypothetical protein